MPSADGIDRYGLLANDLGAAVQGDDHADRSHRERSGEVHGVHPAVGSDRLSSAVRRLSGYAEEAGNQREICHLYASSEGKVRQPRANRVLRTSQVGLSDNVTATGHSANRIRRGRND